MRLYDTQRSGNAWKVRLAGGPSRYRSAQGDAFDRQGRPADPSFVNRQLLGQVPILEFEDGNTLSESMAILHYLASDPRSGRQERVEQARVPTWLSFEQASTAMSFSAQLRRLHLSLRCDMKADDPDMRMSRGRD